MENKGMHIALAIVAVLIVLLGVVVYIHFSDKEADEEVFKESPDGYLDKTVDYEVGEYRYISISEQDLIISYYKNFIKEVKDNPKNAWDMLLDKCKKEKFNNKYEEFEKYINKYLVSTAMDKYTVKRYKYKQGNIYNEISFVDSQNILYEIEERGIWNYKIKIGSFVQ